MAPGLTTSPGTPCPGCSQTRRQLSECRDAPALVRPTYCDRRRGRPEHERQPCAPKPIRSMLDAQAVAGWWVKPGPRVQPEVHRHCVGVDLLGPIRRRRSRRSSHGPRLRLRAVPHPGGLRWLSVPLGPRRMPSPHRPGLLHCLNGNLIRSPDRFRPLGLTPD